MGRTAGCVMFCTGADADRLESCLVDVVRPRIEKGSTHMGNAAGCEGGGSIGYWGCTVSYSGIWLCGWVRIGKVQTGLVPYV